MQVFCTTEARVWGDSGSMVIPFCHMVAIRFICPAACRVAMSLGSWSQAHSAHCRVAYCFFAAQSIFSVCFCTPGSSMPSQPHWRKMYGLALSRFSTSMSASESNWFFLLQVVNLSELKYEIRSLLKWAKVVECVLDHEWQELAFSIVFCVGCRRLAEEYAVVYQLKLESPSAALSKRIKVWLLPMSGHANRGVFVTCTAVC